MLSATSLLCLLFISGVLSECNRPAKLYITAPKKIYGLSDSCLEIPCDFPLPGKFDGKGKTIGVWIKEGPDFKMEHNVIFNSSKGQNMYPMNITGNLSEGNCTTSFSDLATNYSNTYYFRVENSGFKATASCDPLEIKVQDSPPSPEIKISGTLREKQSVNVTCTAVAPCPQFPPRLHWNLKDSRNRTRRGKDGVLRTQILTTLHLTDKDDGFNVTCVASYPVKSTFKEATQAKTLDIPYGPKNTKVSVSPEGLLPAGSLVTLNCSSRAKPPIIKFTWFRISQDGREAKVNVWEGPVYSFNLTQAGVYLCEASHSLSTDSSTIELTIQGQENPSSSGRVIVAGVTVVILLLCGVVALLWFKSRLATSQRRQVQQQAAAQGPSATVKTEEVHYGEIVFSTRTPGQTSSPTTNSRGQQCALSAQEPIYAQVKTKK